MVKYNVHYSVVSTFKCIGIMKGSLPDLIYFHILFHFKELSESGQSQNDKTSLMQLSLNVSHFLDFGKLEKADGRRHHQLLKET